MNSKAYEDASIAHSVALRAYDKVRDGYRAGVVPETEFLAARELREIADAAFTVAFTAEQNR